MPIVTSSIDLNNVESFYLTTDAQMILFIFIFLLTAITVATTSTMFMRIWKI